MNKAFDGERDFYLSGLLERASERDTHAMARESVLGPTGAPDRATCISLFSGPSSQTHTHILLGISFFLSLLRLISSFCFRRGEPTYPLSIYKLIHTLIYSIFDALAGQKKNISLGFNFHVYTMCARNVLRLLIYIFREVDASLAVFLPRV